MLYTLHLTQHLLNNFTLETFFKLFSRHPALFPNFTFTTPSTLPKSSTSPNLVHSQTQDFPSQVLSQTQYFSKLSTFPNLIHCQTQYFPKPQAFQNYSFRTLPPFSPSKLLRLQTTLESSAFETHVSAADSLKEQFGHFRLSVKLCLCLTQLSLCLQEHTKRDM